MRLSIKYRVGQKVFFIGEKGIESRNIDEINIRIFTDYLIIPPIATIKISTVYQIDDREFLEHQLSCSRNGAKQYLKKLIA